MAWLVGIDEAGYGPNLGPLVMTSVACRVPDPPSADLWHLLRSVVRRSEDRDDGRLLVADSKVVYSTARGLAGLERGVLAALPSGPADGFTLRQFVEWYCPASGLRGECWYTGESALPAAAERDDVAAAGERFRQVSGAADVRWGLVRSVVVCAPQFNRLLDEWGSKGAVLAHGLGELLARNLEAGTGNEPLHFCIDKHGGRNTYAAMLQHAMPGGMVVAHEEGMNRSTYSVLGLGREVHIKFQPRADAEHFCVALASMVSKYLREVLMSEFNAFWTKQVPGLKPTAGYPVDAARFWDSIREAAQRLGVAEERLWRRK